jgi:DNA modification methylase
MVKQKLLVCYVPIADLKAAAYNPRVHDKELIRQLKESFTRYGQVDPIIVNNAPNRLHVIVGGHARVKAAKELGHKEIAVVYVTIPDEERERELNLRLNRNVGAWDWNLLAKFDDKLLTDVGFSSEELDDIFGLDEQPEIFDLNKELEKLNISKIEIQKGDVWQLGSHRLMVGDSTIEADVLKLMNGEKADMCMTDPPYILDYLRGKKKNGKPTEGFGLKRDRKYLETDVLPPDFTDRWMANIAKIQKPDFSIMVFENPKNLRTIWNALEKHWKYRNTIIWHLPNRVQGFAAKYKFFNKHDFAMLGTSGDVKLNDEPESDALLQEEYETALFATSGSPHWEGYEKNKKYCPTDFVSYKAADKKSSGQGIIFGTKPVEILLPYMKVLTKRGDLVVEPFGGSGSTLICAEKLKRRCYLMEKSPVYAEVIRSRWQKLTGLKAKKIYGK